MWPINPAIEMREKREAVIMACLNGGQHIDAALEAADRLYPEDKIKEEDEKYQVIFEEWVQIKIKATEDLRKLMEERDKETEINKPWYTSVISRWWPF